MPTATNTIRRCAFVISGFRQGLGTRGAGTYRVWRALQGVAQPDDFVSLHRWNDDWGQVADLVGLLQGEAETPPRVLIAAYSWGAGWGAMRFARELARRGIEVEQMVLSDPVYRHPLWSLAWLALCGLPITVPGNVRRVKWFRQTKNRPMGSRLRKNFAALTKIDPAGVLDREHEWMDDAPEGYVACFNAWQSMHAPPAPNSASEQGTAA